jgi:hypothetical protein
MPSDDDRGPRPPVVVTVDSSADRKPNPDDLAREMMRAQFPDGIGNPPPPWRHIDGRSVGARVFSAITWPITIIPRLLIRAIRHR